MKHIIRLLISLCLPILFTACEEGVFGPRQVSCLEYRQTTRSGSNETVTEREYEDGKLTQFRQSTNGTTHSYFIFTYDNEGRISESQRTNPTNNAPLSVLRITYNARGKWIKVTIPNTDGSFSILEAEYNSQDQIQKFTSSTDRSGVKTINYTITYEWEGGNNTTYTFVSSSTRQVIQYEFDLARENKLRKEQEKLAFLFNAVAHNRNMSRRSTSTVTTLATGVTTQTISNNSYEYNEDGYPERLTRTNTTGTAAPVVTTTEFEYSCD